MPPFQRSSTSTLGSAAALAVTQASHKLTLEDAFSPDVQMSLPEFFRLELESRPSRRPEETAKLLKSIAQEALTAKAKESTTGEQGIFQGSLKERDAIIRAYFDESRSAQERLDEVLGLMHVLVDRSSMNLKRLNGELRDAEKDYAVKLQLATMLERMVAIEADVGYRLQPNDCSRIHKLYEAVKAKKTVGMIKGNEKVTKTVNLREGFMPFIVRHDWSAVLADSEGDVEGEALLPAPLSVFEFRISGMNVAVLCVDPSLPNDHWLLPDQRQVAYVEGNDGWWFVLDPSMGLAQYALKQVHAACVMLEVDVVSFNMVRAPEALNKKRVKQGKPPLLSFHVIDLARKTQHKIASRGDGTGTPRRFHFSRAHNRTYQDGRTIRVKWSFKGNIDLGIVDKQYRL